MKRPSKANNASVTQEFIKKRKEYNKKLGYKPSQWILFCEIMVNKGFSCTVYEARQTLSKYVTVTDGKNHFFKVRFSNHKPIVTREIRGDCDFFVGITNLGTTTTAQAVLAVMRAFP